MPLTPTEAATNAKIEADNLHIRHGAVLATMRDSHAANLLRVATDLDRVMNFPQAILWELKEAGLTTAEAAQELADQRAYYQWKEARLTEIVSLIDSEITFRADGKVNRTPIE